MTPEDEAFAAKKTTLAPGWRKRLLVRDECDECGDCGGYATHAHETPEWLRYCCPPCARAKGAFAVEVVEKGAP